MSFGEASFLGLLLTLLFVVVAGLAFAIVGLLNLVSNRFGERAFGWTLAGVGVLVTWATTTAVYYFY